MTVTQPKRRLEPATRRAQILDSATRLISESGFNTLTLTRLASECGITRAGILHYFSSREDLLINVLARRDEIDGDALMFAPGEPLGPGEIRVMLDQAVQRNIAQPEIVQLYSILGMEALDSHHYAHDYFVERFARARAQIAASVAQWHPQPSNFAFQVLSFMDGAQWQWLRDPSVDLVAEWHSFADRLFLDPTGSRD